MQNTQTMFVRVKSTPNSPRKSVQLVESYRKDGQPRQRIIRHIGVATDDDALQRLKDMAEHIKATMLHEDQPRLFPPEDMAEMVIETRRKAEQKPQKALMVDLTRLRERDRVITGIHEIYGRIYRDLGFDRLLSPTRQRMSSRILYHTVMARLANPASKLATTRALDEDFGIRVPVEKIYRMMDHVDDGVIDRLQSLVGEASRSLLPGDLEVLYFDCTTLYFETVQDDDLRQFGYSKDGKSNRVQILLALVVTREGLPVGYGVFPGATWEGNSFLPVHKQMVDRWPGISPIHVCDAGMLSHANMSALEDEGGRFIIGARLHTLPKALQETVLKTERYRSLTGDEVKIGVFRHKGRRLVVTWSRKRARKDASDRERAIRTLIKRLGTSGNARHLLRKRGTHRYIRIEGKARLVVDEARVKEASRWDGLKGVVTNLRGVSAAEILSRYRDLWKIEESFRITKHDLRARPIFHWTPRRIRAHLALSFMAFTCVRHLEYRLWLSKPRLSPRKIRSALLHQQCSVLQHVDDGRRYGVPSALTSEAREIYSVMGARVTDVPFELDH